MKNVKLLALSTAVAGMLMAEPGMSAETNLSAGSKESSLTFHVGNRFDNNAAALIDDYVDYSATLAKGAWSFMFSDTDLNADTYRDGDPVFVVS